MTNPELKKWLIDNSSGVYRPGREAAELIDRLELENQILRDGLQHVMSEKNPPGFTAAQVARHYLQNADDVMDANKINQVNSKEIIETAMAALKAHGRPMKIKALSATIGYGNPHSLSMILKWSKGRVKCECGRWYIEEVV